MSPVSPPLCGLRVIEFAGLAPVPFAGLILSDFGASVIRIDRVTSSSASSSFQPPDLLARGKRSIAIDLQRNDGVALVHRLISTADIVLDPFRPVE
ncbi:hypothetical protein HK100_012213 [Physocladia obscura]|uniref:CoA transferase n=1 Tax=Physocladia obscura TaxID=109957 RepID=A0AAD5T114_9FUNG|nr:hypothetical protein HK100_012213 [Physocladia obscura]